MPQLIDGFNGRNFRFSDDETKLPASIKQLSQWLHVANFTESGGDASIAEQNSTSLIPVSEIKSHTQLPISNALDKLFYTLFFFLLNVPERLIHRLPDGPVYMRYVIAIQRLAGRIWRCGICLDELYSFGEQISRIRVTRTNELHRFSAVPSTIALLELSWNQLLHLLRGPSLDLFTIEHYVTMAPNGSEDVLSSICGSSPISSHSTDF
ncbi:hypothetical protein FGIG_09762 [Fasciola gigantica]|uniref:Uncharacterized protein n=1 Tax=Fasciola gigantica TaxID=46835 RepID=A0A504Z3E0_FASGI|nr:hypothetical protein FGIG_09762 [Fasciola gigantica]